MKDMHGRKINYMRISITDLCNLRCKYCMPEDGIPKKSHKDILRIEEIIDLVKAGANIGIEKVRITGGEPLVRQGIVSLIEKISKIKSIKDIAITTNGILLKDYAEPLKKAGLKRVNISLDTLKNNKFKEITRIGDINKVFEGIKAALKVGLTPIRVNTVLIKNFNDDEIEDFINLTRRLPIDVRFIELMPIGESSSWAIKNYLSNNFVLSKVPKLEPVKIQELSTPAKYYQLPDALGKVGLINPISNHFCQYCNRIRITSDGKIKPCLHSNIELDIMNLKKQGFTYEEILNKAISVKPRSHHLTDKNHIMVHRNMNQIGG